MRIFLLFLTFSAIAFSDIKRQVNGPITEPKLLSAGAGIFNIVRNEKMLDLQLEYRSCYAFYKNKFLFFRPLFGVMATSKFSAYVYSGVAFDIFFAKSIVFTPSFAPGIYFRGKGMDLGFPLEFRSSVELAYRFNNKSRLGAMFYHLSNASLSSHNPGTECLVFFYAFPLNK